MSINSLFRSVTPIRYELADERPSATGFFFECEDAPFLVTNRHVFVDKLDGSPSEVDVLFWEDVNSDNPTLETLSLFDSSDEPNWLEHENDEVDVALLPLSGYGLDFDGIDPITTDEFYPLDTEKHRVGRDAMVVGYPSPDRPAITDDETRYPVAVDAMISSEYGSNFDAEPFFLTDANTYDGMSGSPVMIRPGPDVSRDSGWSSKPESGWLLGIHSGPYQDLENLDLNRVWYPHLLEEIVDMNGENL
jgi:V8-like Glu-specific endopeptidase